MRLFTQASSKAISDEVNRFQKAVELDEATLYRKPPQLSGGQRQRVAIARAFASKPDLVVCDGAPEVLHALTQARTLCGKLGDTSQLFITLCGQSAYHRDTGNLRESDKLGQQSLELAPASGDPALLLEAHHLLWPVKSYLGNYAAAESHANYGIATYDPTGIAL